MIEEIFEKSDIPQKIDVLDYHRTQEAFQKIINQTGEVLFKKAVGTDLSGSAL